MIMGDGVMADASCLLGAAAAKSGAPTVAGPISGAVAAVRVVAVEARTGATFWATQGEVAPECAPPCSKVSIAY